MLGGLFAARLLFELTQPANFDSVTAEAAVKPTLLRNSLLVCLPISLPLIDFMQNVGSLKTSPQKISPGKQECAIYDIELTVSIIKSFWQE
jgi:hypothetical protein